MLNLTTVISLVLLGISLVDSAWVNFDTWETNENDEFSTYQEVNFSYINPFWNMTYTFCTLPPTTQTLTPRFFKRNYQKFKKLINDTIINKYKLRERFDKFDKHRIIRGSFRQLQKILYLNAPEERTPWVWSNPDSEHHMDDAYATWPQ